MPPNNLAVYLSNRCNLACRYCYVAVNKGEPSYLCAEQVALAIDRYLEGLAHGERKVSFLGGEPLLRWETLEASILHARKKGGPELLLQVFTNGTLLTPAKLGFLLGHGVEVTLSLDGRAGTNDPQRPFAAGPGSSLEAALSALDGAPLPRLGVNMVFTQATLDRLLANIEYFHRLGFGRISFTPDVNEPWTDEKIEALRLVMEGFRRYYSLLVRSGARPFSIANLYAILEKTRPAVKGAWWWRDCHNLVLGGDGNFYACDKSLGFEFERVEADRSGSPAGGVDWEARQRLYGEAREKIERSVADPNAFTSCPMGVVFVAKALGRDPADSVRRFQRVSAAYGDPLLELARELWDAPAFRRAHHIADGTPAPEERLAAA